MSIRQAFSTVIHVPEEEPQEEDDGFSEFLSVCQVPPRAAELHRSTGYVHTCE